MIVTEWLARHQLTTAEYKAEFNQLSSQGFRLAKLSGYSLGGEPRYGTIWHKQGGNQWKAHHGISMDEYQATVTRLDAERYRPTDISVFEYQGEPLFSAIWEQEAGIPWLARHNLTPPEYKALFDTLSAGGFRLRCVSPYETSRGERFACIWDQYSGPDWQARHGLTDLEYRREFEAQEARGYRLVRVVGYNIGGEIRYAAIWEQSPGHPWKARHGIAHASYQPEFISMVQAGYRLVDVSGYPVGMSARYTAVWEASPDHNLKTDAVHQTVVPFMQKWSVPGLSLAVARNGAIKANRCFGYANRITREIVTPGHRFRLASVSKPITSVAVHLLVEQNQLALTDTVFGAGGILGTSYGTAPYDPWVHAITVQHLLEHSAGGWGSNTNDPMFKQAGLNLPDLISWTLDNQPLIAPPGTQFRYSNFGYCLLGRIIEVVSGLSYVDFVQQRLFIPSGAKELFLARKSAAERAEREVMYFGHDLSAPYEVPVERMDAHGGWAGTPSDMLRFLFSVDGSGSLPDLLQPTTVTAMTTSSSLNIGYARGWAVDGAGTWSHDGTVVGTQAILVRPASRGGWCAVCNGGRPNTQLGPELNNLIRQVANVI